MNFLYRHRVALGALLLGLALAVTFGICFFALSHTAANPVKLTVVIDAGHGGVDGGVVGTRTGVKESDVNLALARSLQKKFEEAGFTVVQTRPTEAGLYGAATAGFKRRDMEKRAQIIRESNPAAVISVHQNFFSQTSRRGAQVFYRADSDGGKTLACAIQKELNSMPECVKRSEALVGDYYVLNCTEVPAVIVECGFLSNPEDEALLVTENYRGRIAETILAGTLLFLSAGAA